MNMTTVANPILIVDDDEDDLELIKEVVDFLKIERPVHFFPGGKELISFIGQSKVAPFLILCDVNLPNQNGFDVKKEITEDDELKYRSVPFIYWSNGASEKQIQFAYDLPAQGFFIKPDNFEELCATFRTILEYWQKSQHPKRVR